MILYHDFMGFGSVVNQEVWIKILWEGQAGQQNTGVKERQWKVKTFSISCKPGKNWAELNLVLQTSTVVTLKWLDTNLKEKREENSCICSDRILKYFFLKEKEKYCLGVKTYITPVSCLNADFK